MTLPFGRVFRTAALAGVCLVGIAANPPAAQAERWLVPLAQGAPAPQAPSNVTRPTRMYIVEGIVVTVLFAGAVFAVCRSSGRS